MSLPETCPFCGAEPYTTASGDQCRGGDRWVLFCCDTAIHAGQDLRRTQSRKCEDAERARIAARVAALEAENKTLRARVAELEARCKLLELAGDNLDLSIACGCGVDGPCQMCRRASDSWQQAKEAKP